MVGFTRKRYPESDGESGNEAIQPLSNRKRATVSTAHIDQAFTILADAYIGQNKDASGSKTKELALQERKLAVEERRL
jgi:hypothetical protein